MSEWGRGRSDAKPRRHGCQLPVKAHAAKIFLQTMDAMNLSLTADDMNNLKGLLGIQDDIRKTFSSRGVEPKVLKTLFGDPKDYHVRPCSDDSLTYLLRNFSVNITSIY
jgi:hypothetical protein